MLEMSEVGYLLHSLRVITFNRVADFNIRANRYICTSDRGYLVRVTSCWTRARLLLVLASSCFDKSYVVQGRHLVRIFMTAFTVWRFYNYVSGFLLLSEIDLSPQYLICKLKYYKRVKQYLLVCAPSRPG